MGLLPPNIGQSFGNISFCHFSILPPHYVNTDKSSNPHRKKISIPKHMKKKKRSPSPSNRWCLCSTNKLGFGPEFLGRVRLVTSVASLLGVAIFNTYLKEVPLRKLFLWTTLIGTALGSTQVHRSWGEGRKGDD